MAVDPTMPSTSALHSNAAEPYKCSQRKQPAEADWSIKFGYCRTSLDMLGGYLDKRCPADCPNKAPLDDANNFDWIASVDGVQAAADWVRKQREANERKANHPAA